LSPDPKVRERLQEVQADIIKRADITIDKILTKYEQARKLAVRQAKPEAMAAISEKKAKLVGLLGNRKEVGTPCDFEQMTDISQILAKVLEDAAGAETAEAPAKAFGIG
jgi:2-keto-4-pentenoate hydratase